MAVSSISGRAMKLEPIVLIEYNGNIRSSGPSPATTMCHNEEIMISKKEKCSKPSNSLKLVSSSSSSSSSSSKRKLKITKLEGRKGGSKWSAKEELLIKEAIIEHGEKAADWEGVLVQVNAERDDTNKRTMNSLKLHWRKAIKPKWLDQC